MAATEPEPFDPERPPTWHPGPHDFLVNPMDTIVGDRVELRPGAVDLPLEDNGDQVRYGSWRHTSKGNWFLPEKLSGSDTVGGLVNKTNYRAFIDEYEQVRPAFYLNAPGSHGTYAILLHIPSTPQEVWERLLRLEQYSVWSDEALSVLEEEAIGSAWAAWARDEFLRGLSDLGYECADLGDDVLWSEFEHWREHAAVDWVSPTSEPVMTVNVRQVLDYIEGLPPGEVRAVLDECEHEEEEEAEEEPTRLAAGQTPMPPPYYGGMPPRPPRTQGITERQVRALRERGLREGYDYNPERASAVVESATDPLGTYYVLRLASGELARDRGRLLRFWTPEQAAEWGEAHGIAVGVSHHQHNPGEYWVWALRSGSSERLRSEGPWGPYSFESARTYARISATEGQHDRIVTRGQSGRPVRRYEAGTGAHKPTA